MEVVYWPRDPEARSASEVQRRFDQAIQHFDAVMITQRGAEAKIGITNNPDRRQREHKNRTLVQTLEDRGGDVIIEVYVKGYWSHMHVIYQTPSSQAIRMAEKQLVDRAKTMRHVLGNVEVTPLNAVGGGGGSLTRGPYFLYVLRKQGLLHGGRRAGGF